MTNADFNQFNEVDRNYFKGYASFSVQSGMLEDLVRTGAYYDAIINNSSLFKDKVVIDVGTGTGVLSMFAARAGAKKVYAIEACPIMAAAAEQIINSNGLNDKIQVVQGKVEEINLDEKADIIISEPMGYALLHEKMVQTYLYAKEAFLKPGGLMFPESATMYLAPIDATDHIARVDNGNRGWLDKINFFSINYQPLFELSNKYDMSKVFIDQVLPNNVLAPASTINFNLYDTKPEDLDTAQFKLNIDSEDNFGFNGLCIWFDVTFPADNYNSPITLTTAPNAPLTHWYQTIILLNQPIYGSEELTLDMHANNNRGYDVTVKNTNDKVIKYVQTEMASYSYMEHYQKLKLEPSTKFGYET